MNARYLLDAVSNTQFRIKPHHLPGSQNPFNSFDLKLSLAISVQGSLHQPHSTQNTQQPHFASLHDSFPSFPVHTSRVASPFPKTARHESPRNT